MYIKLNNDREFGYLQAFENEQFYDGASRRVMTFECDKSVISIDELDALLSDTNNIKKITLIGDPYPVYKVEKVTQTTTDEQGEIIVLEQDVVTDVIERYETSKNIYEDYTVKMECGIKRTLVVDESPTSKAIYEDRIVFKLGKPTFLEAQILKILGH